MARTTPDPLPVIVPEILCDEGRCLRPAAYAQARNPDRALCKMHGGGIKRRTWRTDDDLVELTPERQGQILRRQLEAQAMARQRAREQQAERERRRLEFVARDWASYAELGTVGFTSTLSADAGWDGDSVRSLKVSVHPVNEDPENSWSSNGGVAELMTKDGDIPATIRVYNSNSLHPEAARELSRALVFLADISEALNG